MKKKKILSIISALVLSATFGVSSLAACKKEEGHVHTPVWTTDREATCTQTGHKTGKCVCGDVQSEIIPIDPNAHNFDDDWDITLPTETTEGSATRTCVNKDEKGNYPNPRHVFNVVLPKLSEEDKYTSVEQTKKPTIIAAGNKHYVLDNEEAGDIEFDIELPKRTQIETVEDVALYASSLHGNIRKSEGNYIYGDPDGEDVKQNEFSNYYGDDYTRVHDGGNSRDFWYSRDDSGKLFGISAEVEGAVTHDPKIHEGVTEDDLRGFGYQSGGGMRATYGAEETLLTYYEASQSGGAIKYDESLEKLAEGYRCSFSFSRMESPHFCRYQVDFETFATGEIKTLSVRTKIIRSFMLANTFNGETGSEIIYDKDGDIIFGEIYPISNVTGEEQYETNYVYETNEDGSVKYDFVYEYERDETRPDRPIKYDDEGDPIIKKDGNGDPVKVLGDDGQPLWEPVKKYEYEYEKDDNGAFILDEDGNKIFAKDNNGGKIKYEIIGDPPYATNGYKQKPDGTDLLDRFGNKIVRPVPLGFKEGDTRKYYYEAGDKKNDGTGGYYETDHEFIAIRVVNFTQTLKVEGEEVIPNEYPAESVYIRSFGITYKGNPVAEGEEIEIEANTAVEFGITDVQPAETAKLDFDPLKVYLKTNTGEIELDYTGNSGDFNQNAYHIVGHFKRETNTVLINARNSGHLTIILRTLSGKCERELKLNVKAGKPTGLTAQVYMYSDASGVEEHIWTDVSYDYRDPETFITLYEGQSLYVRAQAKADEADYVDASFVTAFETGDETSPYLTLEDGLTLPDGTKVSKITAAAASPSNSAVGVYLNSIYKNSSNKPVAYSLIGIRVVAAPSLNEMFSGEYKGRFANIKLVSGGSPIPADVTVKFTAETDTAGTFTVEVSGRGSVVKCEYSYSFDTQTRALTCQRISGTTGSEDETFNFEFALNERYKLTITHPTFVTMGRSETIVLSRPQ